MIPKPNQSTCIFGITLFDASEIIRLGEGNQCGPYFTMFAVFLGIVNNPLIDTNNEIYDVSSDESRTPSWQLTLTPIFACSLLSATASLTNGRFLMSCQFVLFVVVVVALRRSFARKTPQNNPIHTKQTQTTQTTQTQTTHTPKHPPQQLVSGQRPQYPLPNHPSLSHNPHGNNHNQASITNSSTPNSSLHGLGSVCRATFEDCPSNLPSCVHLNNKMMHHKSRSFPRTP